MGTVARNGQGVLILFDLVEHAGTWGAGEPVVLRAGGGAEFPVWPSSESRGCVWGGGRQLAEHTL